MSARTSIALCRRELEQRIIRDLLGRAERGVGGVVLLDGERGIGKSALLHEATGEATRRSFFVAAAAADRLGRPLPLFALRTALGGPFARFTAKSPKAPNEPEWWISQMGAHLDQRAAVTPVLVCLDDLQWASRATLTALWTLCRELKDRPVAWLLACAGTPHHLTGYLFQLLENNGASRVTLAPLDDDTVASLLTNAFGAPPADELLRLAGGAAGNPALLTELVRGLMEDSAVEVTGDRAVLISCEIPKRVHRVAQRMLDGLSKHGRRLLVTAAVLGPTFRLEDVAEMLGKTPGALFPAIEEVVSAGILRAADNELSFRHDLLCTALNQVIPWPARKALHRQYGQTLLTRRDKPALASVHLLKAAHPADTASLADLDVAAARTLRTAPQTAAELALHSLKLTSPVDPCALWRAVAATEALTAAGRLEQAAELATHTMATPLPPMAEARVRCALSSVLRARGQAKEAADEAKAVLAQPQLPHDLRDGALTALLQANQGWGGDPLAGELADDILAHAAEHENHTTVAALTARAAIAWDGGQITKATALLRSAAAQGHAISPDARHPQPLLALAAALVDLRQLEAAARLLDAAGDAALSGIPAQATLSTLRARLHLANGDIADADAEAQSALSTAEAVGAGGYASPAHCVLAEIALRRGDLRAAAQHVSCGPLLMPPPSGAYSCPEATLVVALVIEARDGPTAAISYLRQTGGGLPTGGGLLANQRLLLRDPAFAAWLVRVCLAAGDRALAAQVASNTTALAAANPGFPALAAAAAHSHGLAHGDTSLLAEASAHQPDRWGRASAAEDLAVLLTRTAKDQAITHLKLALEDYRQIGADRDQARIRQRLRKLGIRRRHWTTLPSRPVNGWDSLTDTEQAVAKLVAEGLNNQQVASRIYISTHTVAHHLRQAFRKLQIGSRVELARIVVEQAAASS